MFRIILLVLGAIAMLTGVYIFFLPNAFYENTPGVSMMGPFNLHFIKDVGLAFFGSGGAMIWGALNHNRAVAMAGATWPFLHALFHIQIWAGRGFPFDYIFRFDLGFVILPACLGVLAAYRLSKPT